MEFHRGSLIDHVHLVVADLEASKRFYRAALGSLGRSITPPVLRRFVLDPDGNNIEAVWHGPIKRSAPSVVLG